MADLQVEMRYLRGRDEGNICMESQNIVVKITWLATALGRRASLLSKTLSRCNLRA